MHNASKTLEFLEWTHMQQIAPTAPHLSPSRASGTSLQAKIPRHSPPRAPCSASPGPASAV
eukprot:14047183-Alexandrium_andersonii.AAC.1